jgi:hypothetical protein
MKTLMSRWRIYNEVPFGGNDPLDEKVVMMRKWKKFVALGAGATAVAGIAAAIALPASASADTVGYITVCSNGGFDSYVSFPDRSGWVTSVIPSGWCDTTQAGGNSNEQIDVYDSDTGQLIGSTIYNGSVGETIVTIAGPSFYAE